MKNIFWALSLFQTFRKSLWYLLIPTSSISGKRRWGRGGNAPFSLSIRMETSPQTSRSARDLKSGARTPKMYSKSPADKKIKKEDGKKLTNLLAYHKRPCEEKGFSQSNLMLQLAAKSSSSSPPAQKPRQEDVSTFKCEQCEIHFFLFNWRLGNHLRKKHMIFRSLKN